jgi:hypothetical protein
MTNQQLTSLSAAASLTVPAAAAGAYVQAETQDVRIRTDGTAPTASVGVILYAGDAPTFIAGQNALQNLKAIEVTASAKLNVAYVAS